MSIRDGGKGDTPRPLSIPMDEFDKKWDDIFKKKTDKDQPLGVTINVENGEASVQVTKTWEI
jgi:hypothetical protein